MSEIKEPKNIIEGLFEEMDRVRGIIKEYEDLPDNGGGIAAALMKVAIKEAEYAIAHGDTVGMIRCYRGLKDYHL